MLAIGKQYLQKIQSPSQKVTEGPIRTPQERLHKIADGCTRKPGNKRETTENIGTYLQDQVARKEPSSSPDHFVSPSKNPGKKKQPKEPSRTEKTPQVIVWNGHG